MAAYRLHKLFIHFLVLGWAYSQVSAETAISDNLDLTCKNEPVNNLIQCQYRLIEPATVTRISAHAGKQQLELSGKDSYPAKNSKTVILFLVDTSDPAREDVVSRNRQDIEKMLAFARPHQQFGLAHFDKGFSVIAPIGSSTQQIAASLQQLHATGKITELYRSTLSAIDMLERVEADRKAIYLLSDGLAEDKAYYHDDVVNAARSAGIIITSLGYPRSVSQSVGLQTIRRLSEETGGQYIEADNSYQLPAQFTGNPFASIDNGGRFQVDISPLLPARSPQVAVTMVVETTGGNYQATVTQPLPYQDIERPAISADTATRPPEPAARQDTSRSVRVITRESPAPAPANKWFWYGIPAALITLLLATIGILLLSTVRQNRKPEKSQHAEEFKPYAYLVLQDETKKRYAITRTTWRIGRGRDNEMILNDSSVSRRHAEIHRDKGDLFTIYDLDSMNGVYVNNNKVSKSLLHEGDIIEIGDINLRFTLLSTDFSVEESTVMQNTRSPVTH